jgi:hypothetical protein
MQWMCVSTWRWRAGRVAAPIVERHPGRGPASDPCPRYLLHTRLKTSLSANTGNQSRMRTTAYAPEFNPVECIWGYLQHYAMPQLLRP